MMRLAIPPSLKIRRTSTIKSVLSFKHGIGLIGDNLVENSLFQKKAAFFSLESSFDSESYLAEFQKVKSLLNSVKTNPEKSKNQPEEHPDEETELLGLSKYPIFFHYEILNLNPYDQDTDIKKRF